MSVASLVSTVVMLGLWPVQALGRALVRFVHAVPGAGAASLELDQGSSTTDLGQASFAQSTVYDSVRTGRFLWKLKGAGKVLASGDATIRDGAWTIVVLAKGQGVALGVYRDRGGVQGTSLLRLIHAAPELGSPMLELDKRVVATGVSFSQATPYARVSPGTHDLAAMKAGDSAPLVSGRVTLLAGRATTAIVVGSRGQRTRVITLTDRGAPLTRAVSAAPGHAATHASVVPAGTVMVRRGDSLWAIARQHLGGNPSNARIWAEVQRLWNLNARRIGTEDPSLIFPGTRLRLN